MEHYGEDELILYFYGEHRHASRVRAHLEACAMCAAELEAIGDTLALVETPDVPERGNLYSLEVWQRIRHRLPAPESAGFMSWFRPNGLAAATAMAVLVIAAFAAGRMWPGRISTPPSPTAETAVDAAARARLVDIGDHLDRSERVLLEVMNVPDAAGAVDFTEQQTWAAELLDANRLYRDAALHAGDEDIAQVLDDLERSLLEVVHGPASLSPGALQELQSRVAAATLLFRVRVLSNELRERVSTPVRNRTTT